MAAAGPRATGQELSTDGLSTSAIVGIPKHHAEIRLSHLHAGPKGVGTPPFGL